MSLIKYYPRQPALNTLMVAGGVALGAAIAGCAHEEAKPAAEPTMAVVAAPSPTATPPSNASVYISDRLKQACGETKLESVASAPKFEFDESQLGGEDRTTLEQVARCLTTGPLKGKAVKLIGRADPRGTASYNMALGERRANTVEKYLGALGVPEKQLTDTSRGSLDAKGDNEAEWAKDRRVDIDIVAP